MWMYYNGLTRVIFMYSTVDFLNMILNLGNRFTWGALNMLISRPYLRPMESESLGVQPWYLCFFNYTDGPAAQWPEILESGLKFPQKQIQRWKFVCRWLINYVLWENQGGSRESRLRRGGSQAGGPPWHKQCQPHPTRSCRVDLMPQSHSQGKGESSLLLLTLHPVVKGYPRAR